MKRITLIVLACLGFFHAGARSVKDYSAYYDSLLVIEEAIASERFDEALEHYAALFREYPRVFARDAFNACQIAALKNDSHFKAFVFVCARSGVDRNVLMANPQIAPAWTADTKTLDELMIKGRKEYLWRIDTNLRKEFQQRFELEQQSKGKPEYKDIVTDNFNRIAQLSREGRFPGEDLIGTDKYLENSLVFATLKHYPYSYSILRDTLWSAVGSGGAQPWGVLYLYGFNQTRTSVLYTPAIPVDTVNYKEAYNISFGRMSQNIEEVNRNRRLRKVRSIETERKLEQVARKYRIDYKMGY